MSESEIVFVVLGIALVLFATGKLRYDIVALGALLILTIIGIVPVKDAYHGFSQPPRSHHGGCSPSVKQGAAELRSS